MRVLLVCTANQCRSPMAEFLLRQHVEQKGIDWQIMSAGTHAANGLEMHPKAQRLLRSRKLTPGSWRTRNLDQVSLLDQDLILVASRAHRSFIVTEQPELLDRTYPLRQFALLAERARATGMWSPGSGAASLIDAVEVARGELSAAPEAIDLSDPVGQPYRRFRACAATIDVAIRQMLG